MAPAKPSIDEGSKDKDKQPSTPRRASAARNPSPPAKRSGNNGVATPPNRRISAAQTPKSAPAGGGAGAGTGGVRKSPVKKPVEPTLLGDFLLGRPSAARVAASKRKSLDAAAVRAELHQQMRQDAVRRVQQPGKVQARVKAWQKASAAAAMDGNPEDAASEPTEVALQVDAKSVTEEDRVRIKSRQKPRRKSAPSPKMAPLGTNEGNKETPAEPKDKVTAKEKAPDNPRIKGPPKKRIVSDEHWMKRNIGSSNSKSAAVGNKPGPSVGLGPSPIPKDFLQKTARPPKIQNKIKDWASKVELPASPEPPEIPTSPTSPTSPKPIHKYNTRCGETIIVEEAASGISSTVKTQSSRTSDDGIRVKPVRATNPQVGADDGIRVRPVRTTTSPQISGDDGIRVKPVRTTTSPQISGDDSIRVKPVRATNPQVSGDDGIRVRPLKTVAPLPDDGIRVRPVQCLSQEGASAHLASSRTPARDKTTRSPSTRRDQTPSARIQVIEEPETDVEISTRKSKSRVSPKRMRRATGPALTVNDSATTQTGSLSEDDQSWTSEESSSHDGSEIPSSAPAKPLAEVPFGYSAFSELDLPVGADHHHIKRPKAQRTSSFKVVPKAFKKIVTGAKDIVHERVDPPKQVTNQPPSIESWLNGTVDPFVDKSAPPTTVEKPSETSSHQIQTSVEPQQQKQIAQPSTQQQHTKNLSKDSDDDDTETEVPERPTVTSSNPFAGLKRSKATRSGSSPLKQSPNKRPLREALNNLFRGESSGHKLPPKAYSSYQDMGPESEISYMDEVDEVEEKMSQDNRRPPVEDQRRPMSPESSYVSTDVSGNSEGAYMTPALPRRRPPPTSGLHELSTIASEELASTVGSETMSTLSDTTVTQTTGLTRSTATSRRSKGSGLKRRLTKHSDLVSVLSLPDNEGAPARARSIRSSSSLRRRTSKLGKGTVDDLLRDFAADEDFYQRELKTLVDGAVPVLLNQVVHGKNDYATDLFGPSTGDQAEFVGKTVVNMGIALEKLRNLHKWTPLHDVNRILTWYLAAYPVYDRYLDVWRLGFEGIIINLAPAPGRDDDEDSLVNAMPRNEDGDVVDTKGQPVDLQHLLSRPVVRIRGLLKLLKSAEALGVQHPELAVVIDDFSALQEKARKRHREEIARKTDEDANNTDTSRCCDLRTLNIMDRILIDPSKQVNAKDYFSLDLCHSRGQRLECQIELIYRDKPKEPIDRGDILIRDVGHARCCLMFPPIPKTAISARRGEEPGSLIVMVRGRHNGKEWYEVFTLWTDLEDQVMDWLDILGTNPVPPATTRGLIEDISSAHSSNSDVSVPWGERTASVTGRRRKSHEPRLSTSQTSTEAEDQPKPNTPSRYHSRHASSPATPTTPTSATSNPPRSHFPERIPNQHTQHGTAQSRSLPTSPTTADSMPLREDMRPEPRKPTKSPPNKKPYREDGAPPPPIHRTFSSEKSAGLGPPVDLNPPASRVRRRGSSPLKHEYRPSDVSSDSSETESDSTSEIESSSDEFDEIDEADVPDTQPAISIKQDPEITGAETVVSDNSIAPSQSASQVGLYGRLGPGGSKDPESIVKTIATISYWSNTKGQWTEALDEPCSILITPGLIEAYPLAVHSVSGPGALNSSGSSELDDSDPARMQPLIALELTPIVMIRQSTVLDVEIRSPVRPYCKLSTIDGKIFRFRSHSASEGTELYMAVHKARLNNAKYKALEEESRFRAFGQPLMDQQGSDSQSSSSHRRGLFGRKNSYRASTRAPSQSTSQSQGTSSSISAPSLLRRLTGGGNLSFNINKSSVDRYSRPNSGIGRSGSLYTSSSSSAGGMTPPRSPSVSLAEASGHTQVLGNDNLRIRCHLLVTSSRWEDHGNCNLQITRPPPGMRQELRIKHGMEKRVIVTKIAKKTFGFGSSNPDNDKPIVVLDVVLGSKCFGRLGTRGIILNVWEEVRDEQNNVGLAPKKGGLSGKVTKWCFQCASTTEANWIFGLVAQEVNIGLGEPLLPEGATG